MIPLAEKVSQMLPTLLSRGEVYLFAIFEREDGKWDILVSSDWSDSRPQDMVHELSSSLIPKLDEDELTLLSRIVTIKSGAPAAVAFARAMHLESGDVTIENSNLFGLQIKKAVLFRSILPKELPPEPTAAAVAPSVAR